MYCLKIFNLHFSDEYGLTLAKRLREFTMTKSVCELIDFDFEPILINLGGTSFLYLDKLILQGNKNF